MMFWFIRNLLDKSVLVDSMQVQHWSENTNNVVQEETTPVVEEESAPVLEASPSPPVVEEENTPISVA